MDEISGWPPACENIISYAFLIVLTKNVQLRLFEISGFKLSYMLYMSSVSCDINIVLSTKQKGRCFRVSQRIYA
jgi:hypothetical protein